jgi:hypothetical protein
MTCPTDPVIDQYMLKFSGRKVGDFVSGMAIKVGLIEQVRVRQNFWAPTGILDDGYPALKWEYDFDVYLGGGATSFVAGTREGLIRQYVMSAGLYATYGACKLQLFSDGGLFMDFGRCSFVELGEPKDVQLLLYPGAVVPFKFWSVSAPKVFSR